MIVNVNRLSKSEIEEDFQNLYIEYFKETLKKEGQKAFYDFLSIFGLSQCENFAKEMVRLIESNERIAFVEVDDRSNYNGLITGRIYEDAAWISHIYIKSNLEQKEKDRVLLELYKAITSEFQKLGKKTVQTEVNANENKLLDMLVKLGFDEKMDIGDDDTIYEKTI